MASVTERGFVARSIQTADTTASVRRRLLLSACSRILVSALAAYPGNSGSVTPAPIQRVECASSVHILHQWLLTSGAASVEWPLAKARFAHRQRPLGAHALNWRRTPCNVLHEFHRSGKAGS